MDATVDNQTVDEENEDVDE